MKYLKPFLVVLSIVISLWLLFDAIDDIDIAKTKNNHLARERVFKIIEYNNTDSLKARANLYLDDLKKIRRLKSNEAETKMRFILVLIVIQFLLLILTLRRL